MKKQNKIYLTIGIVAVVIIAAIMISSIPKEEETIKIGSILSLNGAASSWGQAAQNGMNLAVEDINREGGIHGKKIKIVYENDQSDPTQTVTAYNKLKNINDIKFFIGASWTKFGLPLKDLINNEIFISPSLGSRTFNEGNKYIFNTRQHDYILSRDLAKYIYNKGHRTISILSVNDPYNKEQADELKRVFENLGGTVKYVFEPVIEQKDVRTDLLKIKNDPEIDALVATTGATPLTSLFAMQLRELNMDYSVYSVTIDQNRIDESKGAIDGWIYLSSFTPTEEFSKRYLERYNREVPIAADSAYDAVMILAQAIEETNSVNPELIQQYLNNIKKYSGVSGDLIADNDGGFIKNYVVYKVVESKSQVMS